MKNITPISKHFIVDLFQCGIDLNDINIIKDIMIKAVELSNTFIVDTCFRQFQPQGITGVIIVTESHFAIHTWPEYEYASIDIFTCGITSTPEKSFDYLQGAFKAGKVDVKIMKRGLTDRQQIEVI